MTVPLLEINDIHKHFGGLKVLDGLSLKINAGKIKSLIGPNGAGKTTLFNIISGLENLNSGRIFLKGLDITHMAPEKIAGMGISRTFQTNQVFEHLNVFENIMLGRYLKTHVHFMTAGFWFPHVYREEHRNMVRAYEILEFLGLYEKANRKISQISYMERKLIELGRSLAMEPKLLLLDEPYGGLNAGEGKEVGAKIVQLKEKGISIVLIDHHFGIVSEISDEIAVMNHGKIVAEGGAEEIRRDKAAISASFLGEGEKIFSRSVS